MPFSDPVRGHQWFARCFWISNPCWRPSCPKVPGHLAWNAHCRRVRWQLSDTWRWQSTNPGGRVLCGCDCCEANWCWSWHSLSAFQEYVRIDYLRLRLCWRIWLEDVWEAYVIPSLLCAPSTITVAVTGPVAAFFLLHADCFYDSWLRCICASNKGSVHIFQAGTGSWLMLVVDCHVVFHLHNKKCVRKRCIFFGQTVQSLPATTSPWSNLRLLRLWYELMYSVHVRHLLSHFLLHVGLCRFCMFLFLHELSRLVIYAWSTHRHSLRCSAEDMSAFTPAEIGYVCCTMLLGAIVNSVTWPEPKLCQICLQTPARSLYLYLLNPAIVGQAISMHFVFHSLSADHFCIIKCCQSPLFLVVFGSLDCLGPFTSPSEIILNEVISTLTRMDEHSSRVAQQMQAGTWRPKFWRFKGGHSPEVIHHR